MYRHLQPVLNLQHSVPGVHNIFAIDAPAVVSPAYEHCLQGALSLGYLINPDYSALSQNSDSMALPRSLGLDFFFSSGRRIRYLHSKSYLLLQTLRQTHQLQSY